MIGSRHWLGRKCEPGLPDTPVKADAQIRPTPSEPSEKCSKRWGAQKTRYQPTQKALLCLSRFHIQIRATFGGNGRQQVPWITLVSCRLLTAISRVPLSLFRKVSRSERR